MVLTADGDASLELGVGDGQSGHEDNQELVHLAYREWRDEQINMLKPFNVYKFLNGLNRSSKFFYLIL